MLPSTVAFSEDMVYNDFRSVEVTNFKIPEISCDKPDYSKFVMNPTFFGCKTEYPKPNSSAERQADSSIKESSEESFKLS